MFFIHIQWDYKYLTHRNILKVSNDCIYENMCLSNWHVLLKIHSLYIPSFIYPFTYSFLQWHSRISTWEHYFITKVKINKGTFNILHYHPKSNFCKTHNKVLCEFLVYRKLKQLYVYLYPLCVTAAPWVEFPVLYSWFSLVWWWCSVVLTLCDSMDSSCPGSSVHGIFPGKISGVGYHFLLQETFPTQGLNLYFLHFLHCQVDFLPLAPPGKPSL